MKNNTTLQINSLEALERLIGGDSQLELSIRHSIIEAFSKKYIRNLVKDTVIYKVGEAVKHDVSKELVKEIGTGYWDKKHELTPKAKELIQKNISDLINNRITEVLNEELKLNDVRVKIQNLLVDKVAYISAELTSAELNRRIEKMVDARIKEKLGLKN